MGKRQDPRHLNLTDISGDVQNAIIAILRYIGFFFFQKTFVREVLRIFDRSYITFEHSF